MYQRHVKYQNVIDHAGMPVIHQCGTVRCCPLTSPSVSQQSGAEGWNLAVAAVAVAAIVVLVVPSFTRAWGLHRKWPRREVWDCGIAVNHPAPPSYMSPSCRLLVASLCLVAGRWTASPWGRSNKIVVHKDSQLFLQVVSGGFIDRLAGFQSSAVLSRESNQNLLFYIFQNFSWFS